MIVKVALLPLRLAIQMVEWSWTKMAVGPAGGASALPITPTKYLKVKDSAGTTLVVPAYAAS